MSVIGRTERDGVRSWDVGLHGRRRHDIRATLIVDPSVAAVVWVHFAPPLADSFRKSYRQLLRWNDELPFTKFAVGADERLVLAAELAPEALDRDSLGLALARVIAVCDLLWSESAHWVDQFPSAGPAGGPVAEPSAVLERYARELGELGSPREADGRA